MQAKSGVEAACNLWATYDQIPVPGHINEWTIFQTLWHTSMQHMLSTCGSLLPNLDDSS